MSPGVLNFVWRPTAVSMRRLAATAVIVNAGITVTGATVRVTGSGLGCPSWPRCTPESMVPIAGHSPVNMAIEFGNRLLTFLVLAVAAACVIAALRLLPRRRDLMWLAALQPMGVFTQGLWGGLTVLTDLNPAVVAGHYLLSTGLTAAAFTLFVRSREGAGPVLPLVRREIRVLGWALAAAVLALLAVGTVVTGSGPHGGDAKAPRFELTIEYVARIHADLVWIVLGLTFALWFALVMVSAPARLKHAALILLAVEVSQGAVGYTQYFTGVPALLVGIHVLGSMLVWIATLNLVFSLRERAPLPVAPANRHRALNY